MDDFKDQLALSHGHTGMLDIKGMRGPFALFLKAISKPAIAMIGQSSALSDALRAA